MNNFNASPSLFLLHLSKPFTPSLLLCIRFRTRFSALIKLSHFPSGAHICQENHFLICCVVNMQSDQTIRSSPVIRLPASSAPPTAHAVLLSSSSRFADKNHRKSSTGNSLLCLRTSVNVIAPLPSVSPTSCMKKSLLHMMLSMKTCLASAPSKTWLRILPITFLVQCGRSSSSRLSSLHAFAKTLKASYGTFELHVGTSTAPTSVSRNNF